MARQLMPAFHVLFIAAILIAGEACAGSFQVSPVRIELSPAMPTAAISVRNESTTDSVVVQLRPMNWKQENGQDVYTPSTDLIATPPIFTMKPGATQTIRVGLRKAEQSDIQQTFRIYLTEVPPPPKPGFQGLQVALNIGIPIFIAPKSKSGGEPAWRAVTDAEGRLAITATNPANSHVQVLDFTLGDDSEGTLGVSQEPRYVLAGQSITWRVPLTRAVKGAVRIKARSDAGDLQATVSMGATAPGK